VGIFAKATSPSTRPRTIAPMASREELLEDARERFAPACHHIRVLVTAARTLRVRVAGEMNESSSDVGIACQECDQDTWILVQLDPNAEDYVTLDELTGA
jgi:hypothetical protein